MNEPEGSVDTSIKNSEPCFDTTGLQGTGAGWTGSKIPIQYLQRFANKLASAIKTTDPKALVTIGSWSERASTNEFGYYNYWSDECLKKAGGKDNGVFDFYQIHCYSYNNKYASTQPFLQKASAYKLDKPLVVGEFNVEAGNPPPFNDNTEQYKYLYDNGYQGAWEWGMKDGCGGCDGTATCEKGTSSLKGDKYIDITVSGSDAINLAPRCG